MSVPRRPESWVPWVGLLIAVAGIIYQGGMLAGSVQRNTERITTIEAGEAARSDRIQAIDVRTARIEAKVDLLTPEARKK